MQTSPLVFYCLFTFMFCLLIIYDFFGFFVFGRHIKIDAKSRAPTSETRNTKIAALNPQHTNATQRHDRTPNPRLTRFYLIFIVCYLLVFLVLIWFRFGWSIAIYLNFPRSICYSLFAGPQPTLLIISSLYRQLPATIQLPIGKQTIQRERKQMNIIFERINGKSLLLFHFVNIFRWQNARVMKIDVLIREKNGKVILMIIFSSLIVAISDA